MCAKDLFVEAHPALMAACYGLVFWRPPRPSADRGGIRRQPIPVWLFSIDSEPAASLTSWWHSPVGTLRAMRRAPR